MALIVVAYHYVFYLCLIMFALLVSSTYCIETSPAELFVLLVKFLRLHLFTLLSVQAYTVLL